MTNWSELDHDVLVEIARRIQLYEDFIAFRWVCNSWRSAADIHNFMFQSYQMPLLMLPPTDHNGSNQRAFFNLSKGTITRQVCLPEANNKKCFSSKGWVLTVARGLGVTLLHPFLHIQLELPNPMASKHWEDLGSIGYTVFFEKFVLSTSNLLGSDYTVMVICGGLRKLAYFKSGQKTWITVNTWNGSYLDVVYYKDNFYAINCYGQIVVCDLSGDNGNINPTVAEHVAQMPDELLGDDILVQLYLVESDGELLVVKRAGVYRDDNNAYETYAFQVFKVDLITNSWMEMKDIGNRALFLGHNSSLSIKIFDSSICKPNCIYFTDDRQESYLCRIEGGGEDMGIYDIQDGSIVPHFTRKAAFRSRLAPPMWLEQNFS